MNSSEGSIGKSPPSVLEPLKAFPQWLNCDWETKKPLCPRDLSGGGKTNDPKTWGTFEEAWTNYQEGQVGIGFVVTENDPFSVIDCDGCILEDGSWTVDASEIRNRIYPTYIEYSKSLSGLHFIVEGKLKGETKFKSLVCGEEVEVFCARQFTMLTFNQLPHSPPEPCPNQELLDWLLANRKSRRGDNTPPEMAKDTGPIDQEAVLTEFLKVKFHRQLWYRDENYLEKKFPAFKPRKDGRPFDWHKADAAFVKNLKKVIRRLHPDVSIGHMNRCVDTLYCSSRLMREKWTEERKGSITYGQRTLRNVTERDRRKRKIETVRSPHEKFYLLFPIKKDEVFSNQRIRDLTGLRRRQVAIYLKTWKKAVWILEVTKRKYQLTHNGWLLTQRSKYDTNHQDTHAIPCGGCTSLTLSWSEMKKKYDFPEAWKEDLNSYPSTWEEGGPKRRGHSRYEAWVALSIQDQHTEEMAERKAARASGKRPKPVRRPKKQPLPQSGAGGDVLPSLPDDLPW